LKARLAIAIALGAGLLAVPAALGSNSQSFPDSIGEDAAAPDITSVDVSNDDNGGITFKINVSNRPSFTSDMEFLMFLDTDANSATGDPNSLGADYIIVLDPGTISLGQWNSGSNAFLVAASQTSLTYSYDATGATIHISASELGNTRSVRFATIVESGLVTDAQGNVDDTNSHFDEAPDPGHGFFTYTVTVKVTLKRTAFTTTPAKAGQRLAASLGANDATTGLAITSGTVTCKGIVGGVRVAATHSLRNGIGTCNWKLPKTAKGKLFHGAVTISSQGATLTKTFSARVR
jgi:hypothetical protein